MKYRVMALFRIFCAPVTWVLICALGLTFPVYSLAVAGGLSPASTYIERHIVVGCPVTIEKQECMDTAGLLQSMAGFYETVIMLLIGLLALVAAFVYFSIKTGSVRQIEKQFREDFESEWLQSRLNDKVKAETQKSLADLSEKINRLDLAIRQLSARDNAEDKVPEKIIVEE